MIAAPLPRAVVIATRVARFAAFKRVAASVAVVTVGAFGFAAAACAETWNFDVRLDGKPIGTHRFTVDGPVDARDVTSIAAFDVKLLGITVFRYRHEARERWRGDCLQQIRSSTDDDGKPVKVDRRLESAAPGEPGNPGESECLMSYAYWNPALVRQQRLLNPQTGEVDEVRIERLPDASLPAGGRDVDASRWRITSTAPSTGKSAPARQVLTLWRDRADGRWIGLDAQVKGDRVLTYRLP
jgi:hypothetical protein